MLRFLWWTSIKWFRPTLFWRGYYNNLLLTPGLLSLPLMLGLLILWCLLPRLGLLRLSPTSYHLPSVVLVEVFNYGPRTFFGLLCKC